jgi:hypothetical protein
VPLIDLPADFDSVRRAIEPTLTATKLPDAVIADPLYADAAEDWVLLQYPAASTATGADLDRVKRAAALYAASLLAPIVPRILRERVTDYEYQLAAVDWDARASVLLGRAREELTPLLAPTTPGAAIPVAIFELAPGRRGRP